MEGAPTKMIIEVVDQCPTEALTWKWNDDQKNKEVTEENTNHIKFKRPGELDSPEEENILAVETFEPVNVQIVKDGPILVKGTYLLTKVDGSKITMKGLSSFCRCGGSENKPFCDGTHRKIGVRD